MKMTIPHVTRAHQPSDWTELAQTLLGSVCAPAAGWPREDELT